MKQQIFERSITVGDKTLVLQCGKLAPKSTISIYGRMGDTCVLTTVVCGGDRADLGYFPLSVEYAEKLYAGGIIKGSRWVKREGRPTDEAILKGRLIDRSIRPLFPKEFTKEVQVISTLLSLDSENSPEIVAALTVSAALSLSNIPWKGPISTVRVGYIKNAEGKEMFVINPSEKVQTESKLDLVVSSNEKKVIMIETQGMEIPENILSQAIAKAHEENQKVVDQINAIQKEVGIPKQEIAGAGNIDEIKKLLVKDYAKEIQVMKEKKGEDDDDFDGEVKQLSEEIALAYPEFDKRLVASAIEGKIFDQIREDILLHDKRVDGRPMDQIRPLTIETDILPRTHGSAIFQRGLTQVMSIVTLGATSLEQLIETPEGEETKGYIHHYFSPPYSYGQTGRIGSPGRREVGHGALAEKALEPVLPSKEDFPYAIRVVSEVLSSNGSTSMASTCGSTLALMDAGVPIKSPVAGISIGLIFESDDNYKLLTDIAGIEDFAGHMDFKVAGTRKGVTAIQLDVKNDGLTMKMIDEIFVRARSAREFLLDQMEAVIAKPRPEVSQYAPKVMIVIPPADKIGEIIGPGGRNIKRIIASTGTEINISDDGKVSISGIDKEAVLRAVEDVKSVYRQIEPGESFEGDVTRILPIGAMVEYMPGREGLVHVSKLSKGFVKDPSDVVSIGQRVHVKVLGIDSQGRVNLGMDFDKMPAPDRDSN